MLSRFTVQVLALALATMASAQNAPAVTLNVFDNFRCNNLGSGQCKLQCDAGELSVYPFTCSIWSYVYNANYQRCVTSMPCCYLPGATCQTSCSSGQVQLSSQWTCPTGGQVCCEGTAVQAATTTTTAATTTTASTVANRQGVCGNLYIPRSLPVASGAPYSRLLGGFVARDMDWPWMVRLTYSTTSGFCAGVLVDADTVVTAAHCVAGVSENIMQVILGDYDLSRIDPEEESVGVRSHSVLSGFLRGTRGRDFAVLKLARNITFTDRKLPACLPDPTIPLSSPSICYTAGWGVTERGVGGPMRAANVQILDRATCQGRIGVTLPSDILCVNNPPSAPTDGCSFDDGDMLVCLDVRGRWSLVGLMSEYSCGRGLPILFTDVRPYVSLILSQL